MRLLLPLSLLLLAAPLGGVEPPAEADAPAPAAAPAVAMAEPSDPHAADREAILAASRELSRAYVAGDAAAVAVFGEGESAG